MASIDRNGPCPCGSGKKYKKCCLNKTAGVAAGYRTADRHSAVAKLMKFASERRFTDSHKLAFGLFWGDWLSEDPDDRLLQVMKLGTAEIAYNSWFAFDFELDEGRRLLDLYLEEQRKKLTSGELNYLQGLRESHLRLYEILEVKPDRGFEVRDLWDDRQFFVSERAGTRQIVAWDLVVARVGRGEDGEIVFEAAPYLFRAADRDYLVKVLRKAHKAFLQEFPGASISDFFKKIAPMFHQLWLERVALPPVPKIVTRDGDPVIFARVLFDLLSRDAAIAALRARDDFEDNGDGSYLWFEPAKDSRHPIGTLVIEGNRVVFQAMSQQRAEKARDLLPEIMQASVRFRAIAYEDVQQAIKHAPKTPKRQEPQLPIEAQRKALAEYYDRYYHDWLDLPVPALGNRTPRHAARLKSMRPKLVALLKDFESHSERQRRAGEIDYDFRWMWAELGLTRE